MNLHTVLSRSALVLLTTTAIVTGCGATPEPSTPPRAQVVPSASETTQQPVLFNVGGKPAVNAAEVLSALETAWRAEMVGDGDAGLLFSSSRCYFAATATGTLHTQDGNREAAPVVCGPLGPEKEWKAIRLDNEVDQGASVMLTVKESWRATEPNAPSGFTLQRPDGQKPAAGSNAPGVPGTP